VYLQDPITTLPFVGSNYASKLLNLGINNIQDLLLYFPRTYQDSRQFTKIEELLEHGKQYTISVTISEIRNIRLRNGKSMQKGVVTDDTGSINVTWFNQPFLTKNLKIDDNVILSGKLNPRSIIPELSSPSYDKVTSEQINLGVIAPTYQLTAGISSKWLRKRIFDLLADLSHISDFTETLPQEIIEQYDLIPLEKALHSVHFPENKVSLIEARRRLSFDELLDIQLKLLQKRQKYAAIPAPVLKLNSKIISDFINSLPYKLTESQQLAISDIELEMQKGHPMNRLLQGDVGSGKTVVAFVAALQSVSNNYQCILLAPTAILAQQHYDLATKLFPNKYKIALITSTTSKNIKKLPKLDLIIGTHAILHHQQELLHKPGLIIVDEEHRFGVKQRSALLDIENIFRTHYLALTATPIPRSVALTLFGDMNVSRIEKPSERKLSQTHLVPEDKRSNSITWIKDKIASGGQVFWICPLIDDNPDLEAQSVHKLHAELQQIFPAQNLAVLHGKLKAAQKEQILTAFRTGEIKILISTTVVEVGIDIPNANIILIEDAEKFGLAQLHQLRGRVGRRNQDSWCLLFSRSTNSEALKRLQFFATENDGNKIAEFDLQTRGPGEVYGTIQSGIPSLKIARFSNSEQLMQTYEAAKLISKLSKE
jgi:ATP-dependent DNA helicase RecG